MSLIAELKRRKVFKVGGAYVVLAWLSMQVASIALPAFEAPAWALRVFILMLMLGFPIALVVAWMLDATPEGLKLESVPTGNKRMFAIAGTLGMLALAWYFIGKPAVRDAGEPVAVATPATSAATPAPPAATAAPHKSIAVLAFTDLSPNKDQEYLSDGISEEILNALVKVRGLKVAGRTSSFFFKGRNQDLREIGRTLGVAHVLEGSVRQQGSEVRITAQLIRSDDGFHLWSETYSGELDDVFELQDRISRQIVRELDVVLQSGDSDRMVEVATTSSEAYALYLRATGVFNRREQARYEEALGWLDRAVLLDPDFARAYARAASLRSLAPPGPDTLERAERAAQRALELDPALAEPYAALARAHLYLRPPRELDARDEIERAIALGPDDAPINLNYAQILLQEGYVELGTERLERTLAIDPLLPNALFWRGTEYLAHGNIAAAQQALQRADAAGLSWAKNGLLDLARAQGDIPRARELLDAIPGLREACAGASSRDLPIDIQTGHPGTAAERAAAVALIDRCLASKAERIPFWVHFYLVRLDEPQRALDAMLAATSGNEAGVRWRIWTPSGKAIRALPAFAEYTRSVGLIDVWEKYGPPDACRRVAPRDYRCE